MADRFARFARRRPGPSALTAGAFAALSLLGWMVLAVSAAHAAPPPPVYDDDIPGRVYHIWPRTGTLSYSSDRQDVFRMSISEDTTCYFRVTRTSGNVDLVLRLYPPGATSTASQALLPLPDPLGAGRKIYRIGPGAGGTHYLAVAAQSGSGGYRAFGPTEDDCIPGLRLADADTAVINATSTADVLADRCDVYKTYLIAGEDYYFNVTRMANTGGFDVVLHGPGATDPYAEPALATGTGARSKWLVHTPVSTGYYYVTVKWKSGAGQYRLGHPGSPFGLDAHGYSFKNFGGRADQALFREVFGLGSDPLDVFALSYYQNKFVGSYGGGQCYGFAVTAGMFHRGVYGPKPSDFGSGYLYARDIPRNTSGGGAQQLDEPIERHISKYYYFQYDPDIRATSSGFDPGNAIVGWNWVTNALQAGYADPPVFCFRGKRPDDSTWGHAVNPTGVRSWHPGDDILFSIYDNNKTGAYRWWRQTTGSLYSEDYEGLYRGSMRPTSPHERDHIDPLWSGPTPPKHISVTPKWFVDILHTDPVGRRLGRLGGVEFDEIPGGELVEPYTGDLDPDWHGPVEYYLPPGQDYDVDLATTRTVPMDYTLFQGEQMTRIMGGTGGPDTQWHLRTGLATRSAQMWATSTTPQVGMFGLGRALPGGGTCLFQLSGLGLGDVAGGAGGPGGDATRVALAASPDASVLDIGFLGGGQRYDLTLAGSEHGRPVTVTIPGIDASADSSHGVEVWDWGALGTVPAFVLERLPDGGERILATRARSAGLAGLARAMRDRGLIRTDEALAAILAALGENEGAALRSTLSALVTAGDVTPGAEDRMLAAVGEARSLACSSSRWLVPYGARVTLYGELVDADGQPLPDRTDVTLFRSNNYASDPPLYSPVGAAPYDGVTGTYRTSDRLISNTAFHLDCAGDVSRTACTSRNVLVRSKALMYTPRLNTHAPRVGRPFVVYGYLRPGHRGKTRIEFYRRIGRRWVLYRWYYGSNAKMNRLLTRYTLRARLPHRGWWRIRARHWDFGHAKSYSAWRAFRVG